MNKLGINLVVPCLKCQKPLTDEHVDALIEAHQIAEKLAPHVSAVNETDYYCPECFDKDQFEKGPKVIPDDCR